MRYSLIICIFIITLRGTQAQAVIQGVVCDQETRQPLSGVLLFFAYSTLQATTGDDGTYDIYNSLWKYNELVVTHPDFVSEWILLDNARPDTIFLMPKPKRDDDAIHNFKKSKDWKRHYKAFYASIMGRSEYAEDCMIRNPEVLDFEVKGNELIASAGRPLEIHNPYLGYDIIYDLGHFSHNDDNSAVIVGKPLFISHVSKSERQIRKWLENREEARKTGPNFFFRSFINGNHYRDNFDVRLTESTGYNRFERIGRADARKLVTFENGLYRITLNAMLEIVNKNVVTKEENWISNDADDGSSDATLVYRSRDPSDSDDKYAKSFVFTRSGYILLNADGRILNPSHIIFYGYWANLGITNMLPD